MIYPAFNLPILQRRRESLVLQRTFRCKETEDNDSGWQILRWKDQVAWTRRVLRGDFLNAVLAAVRKGLIICFL